MGPIQKSETVDDDADIDERMRNLPPILDVQREEGKQIKAIYNNEFSTYASKQKQLNAG